MQRSHITTIATMGISSDAYEESEIPFAQVCLRPSTEVTLPSPTGHITLRFPNGVHVCLDAGMEESASRLITSYPYSHVLPE